MKHRPHNDPHPTTHTTTRATTRATTQRDAAIEAIAQSILRIETLAERKRDALDFHEVSVWCLRDALVAAYELGVAAAQKGA